MKKVYTIKLESIKEEPLAEMTYEELYQLFQFTQSLPHWIARSVTNSTSVLTPEPTMKFYIARNTLAVTRPMTKKAALALWEQTELLPQDTTARWQLCKETW